VGFKHLNKEPTQKILVKEMICTMEGNGDLSIEVASNASTSCHL
jgi:hypothetical protein